MKRTVAILLSFFLAVSVLPAMGEEASSTAEKWGNLLNAFSELFESVTEDAADWAESKWQDVQEAAGSAAEWAQSHYEDLDRKSVV